MYTDTYISYYSNRSSTHYLIIWSEVCRYLNGKLLFFFHDTVKTERTFTSRCEVWLSAAPNDKIFA